MKRRNSSRQPTKAQILEDQTNAATKIQAIQRGKADREKVQTKDQTMLPPKYKLYREVKLIVKKYKS